MSFWKKIFGDPNQKILKNLQEKVGYVNGLEKGLQSVSDAELKQKINQARTKIEHGEDINKVLVETFAIVRETSRRVLKMRHFDVQLLGGIILHEGKIAEMKTGEGKTLVATLPVVLNALAGKGVHVVTVNEYLAKRDAAWMGEIYNFLGLSVGYTLHGQTEKEKNIAYRADIIYGTNNEFGFDYLRDNMVHERDEETQRSLEYAIVDEVDSILIDEARTPLIISAPDQESAEEYYRFARLVSKLTENVDYNVDEKMRAATLSEKGITKMEQLLGLSNIYEEKGIQTVHHIEQALKAKTLFRRDRDYVVKENEVIIVDEFTGRLMPGRRYSEGLHQAIEAKENVAINRESVTLATITFQNYFRLYKKLAGMTGTAATEAEEFSKIYNLDVIEVPTNKPMIRRDHNDQIYRTELGKFKAIAKKIKELHTKGQPVLVGTVSIDKNERLSAMLKQEGVPHNVLNAKQHEKEAQIIAQAGKLGAVTVATNMAGRGVDIVLGGNPLDLKEAEIIKNLGGLFVIGSERHEARRIDNQLRGRSGRQGDPGESLFFTSTEDTLLRLFGSERMKAVMETMKIPEDMPIEHGIISKSIETAQKRVEGYNFDLRKQVVEYDDVMNKHREVIYARRKKILDAARFEKEKTRSAVDPNAVQISRPDLSLKEMTQEMIEKEICQVVTEHTAKEHAEEWDLEEIAETIGTIFPSGQELHLKLEEIKAAVGEETGNGAATRTKIIDFLNTLGREEYQKKEEKISPVVMRQIEKIILLQTIDKLWIDHLEDMDALREGIGLRGYGQRDPLVEYKRESFKNFQELLEGIQKQVVYSIYKIGIAVKDDSPMKKENLRFAGSKKDEMENKPIAAKEVIGRNDPCPCGSGRKYKKCCGKN